MTDDLPIYLMLTSPTGSPSSEVGSQYWWKLTGRDIASMLHAAQYPEEAQREFLSYYKDTLCPLLGGIPSLDDETQVKSWTWDGSAHEYSFELKASTKDFDMRFVAVFSQLRPVNWVALLESAGTGAAIASFASRASGFDDTWYRALKSYLYWFTFPSLHRRL